MLDQNQVQVLFADLQTQIVQRSKTTPPEALSQSTAGLARLAKLFSLPMHLSVVPEGEQPPQVIEELAAETAGVPHFLRMSASPLMDEKTRTALSSTGRKTLIIAGFATEVVVLHAVQEAITAGYQVYVPVDTCGGMSARTEEAAFREIEAAGGVTTSVVSLVTATAPDQRKAEGRGQKGKTRNCPLPLGPKPPTLVVEKIAIFVSSVLATRYKMSAVLPEQPPGAAAAAPCSIPWIYPWGHPSAF